MMFAIAVVWVRVNRGRLSHYDPMNMGIAREEREQVALVDLEDVVSPDRSATRPGHSVGGRDSRGW